MSKRWPDSVFEVPNLANPGWGISDVYGFPWVIFLVPIQDPFGTLWVPFGTILGSCRLLWMPSGTFWGHIVFMAGFGNDLTPILELI